MMTLDPYTYDPEAAMALLEEAGWVDSDGDGVREKDGVPLAFTIAYSSILQMFESEALIIQDQLNQIGFDVSVEHYEWGNYLEEIYFGQKFDATPMTNSDGAAAEPNTFMSLMLSRQDVPGSGNNITSYVNPEMDALIDQARSVAGCAEEERAELYDEIQRICPRGCGLCLALCAQHVPRQQQSHRRFRTGRNMGLLRLSGSSARVGYRRVGALTNSCERVQNGLTVMTVRPFCFYLGKRQELRGSSASRRPSPTR